MSRICCQREASVSVSGWLSVCLSVCLASTCGFRSGSLHEHGKSGSFPPRHTNASASSKGNSGTEQLDTKSTSTINQVFVYLEKHISWFSRVLHCQYSSSTLYASPFESQCGSSTGVMSHAYAIQILSSRSKLRGPSCWKVLSYQTSAC